jgi:hypothetical protein
MPRLVPAARTYFAQLFTVAVGLGIAREAVTGGKSINDPARLVGRLLMLLAVRTAARSRSSAGPSLPGPNSSAWHLWPSCLHYRVNV